MSRYQNALSQAASHARTQRWTIGVMAVVTLATLLYARNKDVNLTAHVPPDLSNGATIKIGGLPQVPAPNVYAFGFYIWQQVNNWPTDGKDDYGKQIFNMQYYVTPACRAQLEADMRLKSANGELAGRTRSVMEIPGQGFAMNRVTDHGNGAWTVLLDAALLETSHGIAVKRAFVRYPLYVVRYDVSRENNPYGLAVDCFGDRRPERLEIGAIKVEPMPAPAVAVPQRLPDPVLPMPTAPTSSVGAPATAASNAAPNP